MRESRTAAEIQSEVTRLVNVGRKVPITVPLPVLLSMPSDPFDDRGANWMIPAHSSFAADREAVRTAITSVKAKWDMK